MIVWIIVTAMAVLTMVFLARPFLRVRTAADVQQPAPDVALHRARLAELEDELSGGFITSEQAEAARAEIERRLLMIADAMAETTEAAQSLRRRTTMRGRVYGVGFVAVATIGAVAFYLMLGTPGLPSIPIAEQRTAGTSDDFTLLVERLAARMAGNPDDARGWALLARSYVRLQRFSESAEAYRRAIELGSREPGTLAAYGEVLVASAQGVVSKQARTAFENALASEPSNPRARYYLGLAAAQGGDLRGAYDIWNALVADTPPTAPWRATLEAQLRQVASDLGIAGGEEAIGPSDEAFAAAAEMSEAERTAFITSMVDRLAARLASTPDDFDGWMRLGHAYRVLGDREAAAQAFGRAAEVANARSFDPTKREAARRALDEIKSSARSR